MIKFFLIVVYNLIHFLPTQAQEKASKNLPGQYKKYHRPIMAKLGIGEFQSAILELKTYLRKAPHDAETLFCLALAYSGSGDGTEALNYAKKAMSEGLPLERFIAGPRSLNEGLLKTDGFVEIMRSSSVKLVHGPMIGDLSSDSVKIWIRASKESEIKVVIEGVTAERVMALAKNDYTALIQIKGLDPDTFYHYQIFQNDHAIDLGIEPGFRTQKKGGGETIKIIFGGGAGFTPKYERIWRTIKDHKPDALLLLGDNVYIDRPEIREVGQYCYFRRQSRPEWRKLIAGVPVYAIWDDHDFGTNDCHGGAAVDEPEWKPKVWADFKLQWPNPEYGGKGKHPGCYFTHQFGQRVEFIFMDTRYYREPSEGQMLGPIQLSWLKRKLKNSKAKFKVICSSVPMTPGVKPGSKDTWDGYSLERMEIFSYIKKNKISGVFVLAADRHRSDAWKNDDFDSSYPIYEFMSSKLTNIHTHKIIKGCIFGYNEKPSFGEVTFDFSEENPTATYTAYSIDNENVGSVQIGLKELQYKK
ncbi:MAG: alkaline phosphatase D family protein [Verrucomicrobiales bacterium]|nr:alkaline phosphatase D family protein [Verrucomicrobiales bacterium]